MERLGIIWKNRNRIEKITKTIKKPLIRTLIFPIFLYAAETRTTRGARWTRGLPDHGRSTIRWTDQIKSAVGGQFHECMSAQSTK